MRSAGPVASKVIPSVLAGVKHGTHLCAFYGTKDDLIDLVLPFFTGGAKRGDACVWMKRSITRIVEAAAYVLTGVSLLDWTEIAPFVTIGRCPPPVRSTCIGATASRPCSKADRSADRARSLTGYCRSAGDRITELQHDRDGTGGIAKRRVDIRRRGLLCDTSIFDRRALVIARLAARPRRTSPSKIVITIRLASAWRLINIV
jgi:hypothetical protein